MIACIDGGLFCIGIPILLSIFFPSLGIWIAKKFKWCKKSCHCKCHNKLKVKGKPWENGG